MPQPEQEAFLKLHSSRHQLKLLYQSELGKKLISYLENEKQEASDALVYGKNKDKDETLKGKIQALYAVINLVDYLYSMEVKKEQK